jgi:hypothetical protein
MFRVPGDIFFTTPSLEETISNFWMAIHSNEPQFDRSLNVNKKVLEIIESPETFAYLGSKLIRRKPKLMPRFVWRFFLFVVEPRAREKPTQWPRGSLLIPNSNLFGSSTRVSTLRYARVCLTDAYP